MFLMFFMTLLMGLVLSAIFTWQAQGFGVGFVSAWVVRFVSTYIIVLPTVLVISPIAQWLAMRADRLFASSAENQEQTLP
jgi:Protein of unknown function (DUF2798)